MSNEYRVYKPNCMADDKTWKNCEYADQDGNKHVCLMFPMGCIWN